MSPIALPAEKTFAGARLPRASSTADDVIFMVNQCQDADGSSSDAARLRTHRVQSGPEDSTLLFLSVGKNQRETQMHFGSAAVWRDNLSIGMHLRLAGYGGE